MKKRGFTGFLICALACVVLAACGGKGGGSSDPTTAIVKISTQGTLAPGTKIDAIELTVTLPSGASVKASPDSANPSKFVTNAGVVTPSGAAVNAGITSMNVYTASTRQLSLNFVTVVGFDTGEFVTIHVDLAPGSSVSAANIGLSKFKAWNDQVVEVTSSLTPVVSSVTMQ